MIAGEEKPDGGSFKVGETVQLMYVNQTRDSVDREKTVFESISNNSDEMMLGTRSVKSRAYLSWFNFRGGDQQKPVSGLSGGELNRLNLARSVCQGGNLLLLDEPTNDADAFFLQRLENALLSFAGCAICVSHDRFFLDRVATHILAFEGDVAGQEGKVVFFDGNFESYEQDKKKRLGETMPSRMKFAKLPAL
jgi:energy-dependent translational throttle protein EttA